MKYSEKQIENACRAYCKLKNEDPDEIVNVVNYGVLSDDAFKEYAKSKGKVKWMTYIQKIIDFLALQESLKVLDESETTIPDNKVIFKEKEIELKIRQIISNKLGLTKDISNDMLYETLGSDSLDDVEIVMDFEDAFNISIDDIELDNIRNSSTRIQHIVNLVLRKILSK